MNNDASPPPSAQLRAWPSRPTIHADAAAAAAAASADIDAAESRRRRHVTATLEAEAEADFEDEHQGPAPPATHWSREGRRRRRRSRRKRNPGLVKKLAFVTHLLKTLDLVVFAELSALYYMECSIFRFALRILGQSIYLTPKDESFPLLMPASRIHLLVIVVPNIICMLLHLLAAQPQGPDFHRGYQHGGLIIDFIGQKPPTSRMYYICADVLILAVQCLMLSIHSDRESLRAMLKTPKTTLPEITPADPLPARSAADLDAEERGVSRLAPDVMIEEANGIELQPLSRGQDDGGEPADGRNGTDVGGALGGRDGTADESSRTFLSDLMSSGNAIIGEYHMLNTLKSATMHLERTASYSLQTVGYRATMAAIQARRRHASLQNQPAPPGR
ncbi:DSC E3 ubiquitin ligase complex subunit 4 [Escovopsis weberi]|uniref:DSC E3 ubiquitin ligase complex subunit 4 n=1 Tax=Escovopsis weberi TaxID=150374 RepID=A0A0M9VRT2_ESCWE|nr:DSC E3 ubiquitin ligase complex subunit 4 [Escovopsis weberi]